MERRGEEEGNNEGQERGERSESIERERQMKINERKEREADQIDIEG